MSKYGLGQQQPSHAQRYRFKTCDGQQPHEWRVTQARLIFIHSDPFPRNLIMGSWTGLYVFDQTDSDMALKLKELLLALEGPDPIHDEIFAGLGQVIRDVIYLIASNWLEFFNEADAHLEVMVGSSQTYRNARPNTGRANNASPTISPLTNSSGTCATYTNSYPSGPTYGAT